jgi:leucyl-tRNA synthetase
MFGFDWQKGGPWNDDQISGVVRWLHDIWDIVTTGVGAATGNPAAERHLERKVHQAIDKVSTGLEKFGFNTSIAGLMELRNELKSATRAGHIGPAAFDAAVNILLRLMAPFTPHIAEELWARAGFGYSIHRQEWPVYDPLKAKEETVPLVVMINGKPRETIQVDVDISQAEAEATALAAESVQKLLNGSAPQKVIYIAGRKGQEPKVNVVLN